MHLRGEMPKSSRRRAEQLLTRAARGGDVGAAYLLASMHEKGDGAPRDLRLARYWCGVAARNGDEAAPSKLRELDTLAAEEAARAPP